MKYITFLLLFVAVISGCKKNATDNISPGNYSLTMTIDGKNFSFNDSLVAKKTQSTGITLQIDGYSTKNGAVEMLFPDFSTGTYSNAPSNSSQKAIVDFSVVANYYDASNNLTTKIFVLPYPSSLKTFTITITNSNSTYIEGTFSGSLSDGSGNYVAVTDGQFKVPFK